MSSDKENIVEGFLPAESDNDTLDKVVAREASNLQQSQEELFKQNIQTEREQHVTYEGEELPEIQEDGKNTEAEVQQLSNSESGRSPTLLDNSKYEDKPLDLDSNTDNHSIFSIAESLTTTISGAVGKQADDLSTDPFNSGQDEVITNTFSDNIVDNQGDHNPLGQDDVLNQAPVAYASEATTDEDNSIVGQLSASDPDAADILNFTLLDNVAEGEVIVNPDGSFIFKPNDDFQDLAVGESREVSFAFQVQDIAGSVSSAVKTIIITGSNDGPVARDTQETIDEDNILTGQLVATDIDASDVLSYSLVSGPEQGTVTVNADGSYIFNPHDEFQQLAQGETQVVSFIYKVSDNNGGFDTAEVTLKITGNNDAPVDIIYSNTSVLENSAEHTVVGTLQSVIDIDINDIHTFKLLDDANGAFAIDSQSGKITVADSSQLNFEESDAMEIIVQVTDENGLTLSKAVIINVTDDNTEFSVGAVTDSDSAANSINESASIGTSVGITAFAEDSDGSDSVTYSLTTNPNNAFAIDPNTGEVTVADPNGLDFETAQTMQIEVTATSTDGSTSNASFKIAINDVNEGAVVTTSNVSGNEDSAIALNIQLAEVEPGANVVITINGVPSGALLSAGVDNGDGSWSLDQSDISGLTITPAENSSSDFSLHVQTDVTEHGTTLSYKNSINVNVDAVADTPVIIGPDAITHLQNQAINFEGGLGGVVTLGTVNNPNSFGGQTSTEGSQLAQLLSQGASDNQIEAELGLASGTLDALSPGNATDGSSLQTAIAVEEGDVITFDWNFVNAETVSDTASGFNDFAIVSINGSPQELARSSDLNGPGSTGWQTFTFTATQSGVLDLGFAMLNTNDTQVDSSLLIDNIEINDQVVDVRPVDLNLNISLVDTDGSESLSVEIAGVPQDAALSSGVNLGGGVWTIATEDVSSVQLIPSATSSGTVSLTITATSTEMDGGDTSSASHTIDVTFYTLESVQLGSAGDDIINGNADNNIISGKSGADIISGGDGHDYISGGEGDDIINGGAGDDQLFGDAGNDILTGGAGNDYLSGGDGDDIFIFAEGSGKDIVQGGAGWDVILLEHDLSNAVDPDNPWQIEINGEQVDYDLEAGVLELDADTSGVITFDDGSEVTFDGVEQIQW